MNFLLFKNKKKGFLQLIISFIIIIIIFFIAYSFLKSTYINKIKNNATLNITNYSKRLESEISNVSNDLYVFDNICTVSDFITKGVTSTNIDTLFFKIMEDKSFYDQIRILDISGMELLRINNGDTPYIIPSERLQDKSDRYYFLNSIDLSDDSIYLSNIDLNIENGRIELVNGKPKPILRASMPIYNLTNKKQGVIIINYLIENVFKSTSNLRYDILNNFYILDHNGYFLNSNGEHKDFGFMNEATKDEVYSKYSPYNIFSHKDSVINSELIDEVLYISYKIDNLELQKMLSSDLGFPVNVYSDTGDIYIVSSYDFNTDSSYLEFKFLSVVILVGFLILAYIIILLIDRNAYFKEIYLTNLEQYSNYDNLTKLPNRRLTFEIINKKIKQNQNFAIMFLDLDGFKNINDTYGHDVGDLALIEAARRFKKCVRNTDFVARLGGDEFVIVIDCYNDKELLTRIASDIVAEIKKDLVFNDVICNYGTSIGIAFYETGMKADTIIERADSAMYHIKKSTKNGFVFYDDLAL